MSDSRRLISAVLSAGLFILLETGSALMIVNNGIVQKFKALNSLRGAQSFLWEKEAGISRFLHYKTDNEALSAENIRLKNEISAYRRQIESRDSSIFFSEDRRFTYLGARVIKNTLNSRHNYLVLDKGESYGIRPGMGVVTASGVIGIVESTSEKYCSVISFINSSQNVSVKLTGNGMFGPMSWDGQSTGKGILRGIPAYVEVSAGDSLVTSGYSDIFPPDIPVGTVTGTNIVNGISQDIEVQLFEDFRSLRTVYVVMDRDKEEIDRLVHDGQ